MGNSHIKDFFSNNENLQKNSQYLLQSFNAEVINQGQIISERWLTLGLDKMKDAHNMFDWSCVQSNLHSEQVEEKIQRNEFKEHTIIGKIPNELNLDLLNPAFFDEIQIPFSQQSVIDFRNIQNQKFLILYQLFYLLYGTRKKDHTILNSIKTYLASPGRSLPKAAEVGIRSGIHLVISLLREASKNNAELVNETLNFLMELFSEVKPLSLWGTKQIDIVLDKSLHTVAEFLEELIDSENTDQIGKEKALKVLFSLGLLRGSLPNLLSVVDILRRKNLQANLKSELSLLKNENADSSLNIEGRLKSSTKVYYQSKVKTDSPVPEKPPYVSVATNGKYLYIHSELEGLLKVGTGFNHTTMGKVYKHLPEFHLKERSSLAFVMGKLYFRSYKIAPLPFITLDPDTLEELNQPILYDANAPNCLWPELTNPEIEFPHANTDKQNSEDKEIQNQKQTTQSTAGRTTQGGPQKRDLRLLRPSQRSPVFTEGRYLYIISQWTVESRRRANDSDDEDESEINHEVSQARFGVDIYDPLLDFEHVKTVELLNSVEEAKSKKNDKKNQKPVLDSKIIDQAAFITNGTELLVIISPKLDKETKYKTFSLKDGKMTSEKIIKEATHLSYHFGCFDYYNNVVWSLFDDTKTFTQLACFNSGSIPQNFDFSEDTDFFNPYQNEKIFELAADGLNILDFDQNNDKEDVKQDDLQVLASLGFPVSSVIREAYKAHRQPENEAQDNQDIINSRCTQLFILANIARLSDCYASLERGFLSNIHRSGAGEVKIEAFRRPYCIHLIPNVFEKLDVFVDYYSKAFFSADQNFSDDVFYNQCAFLCTLRILKYNLAASEVFQDQFQNTGIKLPSVEFAAKFRELINNILNTTPSDNKEYEELRKTVYNEALEILRYNLTILYPDIQQIIDVLQENINQIDNTQKKDVAFVILAWLKEKPHVTKLVEEISQIDNKEYLVKIKQIIEALIKLELENYNNWLISIDDEKNIPKFRQNDFVLMAMSFVYEFQQELLIQAGQKVQEKTLEDNNIFIMLADLTEIISQYGRLVNDGFNNVMGVIVKVIDRKFLSEIKEIDEEAEESKEIEIITNKYDIPKEKIVQQQQSQQKNKTKQNEAKNELIEKFWDNIFSQFLENSIFSQVLSFQVNSLSLISSNFLIASKTMRSINLYLTSLNDLYKKRCELMPDSLSKFTTTLQEKSEVFESEHPYAPKLQNKEKVYIAGAKTLRVVFDPKCDLKRSCDYLQFFSDEKHKDKITEKMDNAASDSSFPKEELLITGDTFYFYFYSDNCRNTNWGYKFTVFAQIEDQNDLDWIQNIHRTTCWLSAKCAAQLINGSALQQALLADEEQRYNALLNSKLFSGGMEKCYFSGGKEGIWQHLYEISGQYGAGHLGEYLSSEITPAEKEEEELLNNLIFGQNDEQIQKLLDVIQRQFSRECLWANIGGEHGSQVVRAAFAVIVKHGGLINDIRDAIKEINTEGFKPVNMSPTLKNLLKKWHAASRMRTWLVEKKKEIDDMHEQKKQMQQAPKKVQGSSETSSVTDTTRDSGVSSKRKKQSKRTKMKLEEENQPAPPLISNESFQDQENEEQLQVIDTEEIVQKMIDGIVKKAQFLIQLIPSKHWFVESTDKKEKQLLFRATHELEETQKKEDEWKLRLQQWKSVRQSKMIIKNFDNEIHEIHLSLTSSALLCLQSAVSIRRLRKQVESAYLRAICRTIGFNALTKIISEVPNGTFRQDVVGWLCSSLRGNENKLYHFTDNLQGCGHYLESVVTSSFMNLATAIISSMVSSTSSNEIKSLLEGLKWKYQGEDYRFLSEINLFGVLRGSENEVLIRKAWGKSFENKTLLDKNIQFDPTLVKKLVELFEILVTLCVGRLNRDNEIKQQPIVQKKGKEFLLLEKNESFVDHYSAEILAKQAFSVIFEELAAADQNYRNFEGLDWLAYLRAKLRQEKKKEKNTKKDKKPVVREDDDNYQYGEEDYNYGDEEQKEIEDGGRNRSRSRSRLSSDSFDDDLANDALLEEVVREEEKVEDEQEEEEKNQSEEEEEGKNVEDIVAKLEKDKKREQSKKRKLREIIEKEERILHEMELKLYNPEFLYRILLILYKCIAGGSEHALIVVAEPRYITITFSLLHSSPPSHKMILCKILNIMFNSLPHELFTGSLSPIGFKEYFESIKKDKVKNEIIRSTSSNINRYISVFEGPFFDAVSKMELVQQEPIRVLAYLLDILIKVRSKTFIQSNEQDGEYLVSCEIITLLRNLLAHSYWKSFIQNLLFYMLNHDEKVWKMAALQVFGGEVNGLRLGGKIQLIQETVEDIYRDNFVVKNEDENVEYATVLGFTSEYKEKNTVEEAGTAPAPLRTAAARDGAKSKDAKQQKHENKIKMRIGSVHEGLNPIVLINSTINKDLTSFGTIELTTVERYTTVAIDEVKLDKDSLQLENKQDIFINLFSWALNPSNYKLRDSQNIYLKTLIMKSLYSFLVNNPQNITLLVKKYQNLVNDLVNLACQKVCTNETPTTLELSEERLYRLVHLASESPLCLGDLENITLAVKNNEVEVLYGKDLSNSRFTIISGYNIDKCTQYYAVIVIADAKQFISENGSGNIKKLVENKIVIMQPEDVGIDLNTEISLNCHAIITHTFDMQKFQEIVHGPEGNTRKLSEAKKKKKLNLKTPNCIINILEKSFNDIVREAKNQQFKEYKDVFTKKRILDELVEFGFPKDICEQYLLENPKTQLDLMISDLAKIMEGDEKDTKNNHLIASAPVLFNVKNNNQQGGPPNQGSKKKKNQMSEEEILAKEVEKKFKQFGASYDQPQIKGKQNSEEESKDEEEKEENKDEEEKKEEDDIVIPIQNQSSMLESQQQIQIIQPKEDVQVGVKLGLDDIDSDEEQVQEQEVVEKEEPNPCFKTKGEKELQSYMDEKNREYDEGMEFEQESRIGTLILFKQTNYNLAILYARRIILELIEKWPEDDDIYILTTESAEQDTILRYIKLLVNEGMLSKTLLQKVRLLIDRLFSKSKDDLRIGQLVDNLAQKSVIQPLRELNNRTNEKKDKADGNKKGDKKIETEKNYITGRNISEYEIEEPSVSFSLWLAQVMMQSSDKDIQKKMLNFEMLFLVLNLVTQIRSNKALVWGSLLFSLNLIEFFRNNIEQVDINNVQNILGHESVKKLHEYLHKTKTTEKTDEFSKRTQIITEVLISINRLARAIDKIRNNVVQDYTIDLSKYKNLENLTDVVEMMENFQENRSLIASTWLQMSSDLIKNEQKVLDGDHFYYKSIHTFKVVLPHASEAVITFSDESQTDIGDSLLFSSDVKGELSLQKIGGNLSKKVITFPSGTFYVHFPTQGSDIYGFGSNDNYQLGSIETSQEVSNLIDEFPASDVVMMDGGDTHSAILLKTGELYACGTGAQTGISNSSTRTISKVTNLKDKVKTIGCGSNFTLVALDNHELYAYGSNADGRCGISWSSGTFTPTLAEFSKSKTIKQIACGVNHSLILTIDGLLYATGSNEHGQLGLVDDAGNKLSNITTFRQINDLSKKLVKQCAAGQNFSIIVVKDKNRVQVMSCGEKSQGRLGHGESSSDKHKFTEIEALQDVDVKYIYAKRKHVLAITKTNKVYSWGAGEAGQLGHETFKNEFVPKQIEFFNNMKVITASVATNHSVVIVRNRSDDSQSVYGFGDNQNGKIGFKVREKVATPQLIEFFEGKNSIKTFGGAQHSFILTENMKVSKNRDTHNYTCHISGEYPIRGSLYVGLVGDKTIYISQESAKNQVESIPDLTAFVKEAISLNKEYHWPLIDNATLNEFLETQKAVEFPQTKCVYCSVSPIKETLYINMHIPDDEPAEYCCEQCVSSFNEREVSPTLYYRIQKPFKPGKRLPSIPRTQFYSQSDTFGYNVSIVPKYNEKGHDYVIQKYQESYLSFSNDMKNLKPEIDEQLVDLLNNIAQKQEKNIMEIQETVTFPKDELNIRGALEKSSTDFLRKRFIVLKNFNSKVQNIIPLIDFSARKFDSRLRNIYSSCNMYIFWDIKAELFDKILYQGAKPSGNVRIKVNRMKAAKFIQKGKPDHTAEFTVFGQIFQYFKTNGYNSFKVTKDANPFSVQFVGEASIDAGGPYREAVSQICTELQSTALPLLIPSPNQKNDGGQFREKWILNPGANSLNHIKMLEFVGVLMGCSIRTKNFLNLDLPSFVWKQLVDVPLTRKDLEYIDRYTVQCLDDIININKKGITPETFGDLISENFVTCLSDGTEVELFPGGRSMRVTYELREEYANLVEKIRLNEMRKQAEALRKGLTLIVPEGLLNLLTWRELETLVCGKSILDIELLKLNTTYRNCSENDSVVEYFWKALVEFSPEERSMYLRFVWGRSRLPLTSKDFTMKHQIEIIKTSNIKPDLMLPVAHTCFFSIELPKYSSYEILRDKLRYAITHCQAIDTDGRAYDVWDEDD